VMFRCLYQHILTCQAIASVLAPLWARSRGQSFSPIDRGSINKEFAYQVNRMPGRSIHSGLMFFSLFVEASSKSLKITHSFRKVWSFRSLKRVENSLLNLLLNIPVG